ncbi:4-hydroxy-tetrahydrodipicolinate synthase [Marivirga lumbricoides]|uniref:4-hydroxy-tetrahydrodipicolinate synthase n=1 Tax=Marivirga lumbricoides TaxID=1046115 RepID=A0ABQ1N737_9BACT|nr:4-hydroxy-tetrahydrodipicolinate synthase [Marivirga lumbricoides]
MSEKFQGMTNKFTGVGPALITPFKEDLSIDFEGLENLLKHVAHADYWVVQGTTGESATTTREEKQSILDFVKKHNPNKLPLVYGIGGNNTQGVIDELNTMNLDGVDAILSASPYYNKPSQEGIYRHYSAIADASPVPLILYNVPGRTASNISAGTTLRLAQHANIIGVKEASGNMEQCMKIASEKPESFLLISGDDMLTTSLISLGAVGVISVMANAFPSVFSKMTHSALKGDYAQANENLFKLLDINPLMYEESNPVGVKEVLHQFKICKHFVRLPLVPATVELQQKIKTALSAHSLT